MVEAYIKVYSQNDVRCPHQRKIRSNLRRYLQEYDSSNEITQATITNNRS